MKKILFIASFVMLLVFSLNTNVYAADYATMPDGSGNGTLEEAIAAAGNTEATIKLVDDVVLTTRLKIPAGAKITLDLNGKTLTLPSPEDTYGLVVAGDVTITGKGTVNAGMYGIGVTGNLVIEDGTYNCSTGDYLIGSWGKVTIKGGTFNGNYCIANGFDGGKVEILDGVFNNNDAEIVLGGATVKGGTFSQIITEEYIASGAEFTVKLGESVTIEERLKIPAGAKVTLDLNGKTLTLPSPDDNYGFVVAGDVTITGKGTVNAGMYGIGVTGNLVIEDGTYNCPTGDYLIGSWGKVTIKGGTFNGNYCIANGFGDGKVEILDGEFSTKEETIVLGGVTVKGGTYNQDVTDYVATDLDAVKDEVTGEYFVGTLNAVNVSNTKNGTVKVSNEQAVVGQSVKVTATPEKGYKVGTITVKDASGAKLTVKDGVFAMPASAVTVSVTFAAIPVDDTPATGSVDVVLVLSSVMALVSAAAIVMRRRVGNN